MVVIALHNEPNHATIATIPFVVYHRYRFNSDPIGTVDESKSMDSSPLLLLIPFPTNSLSWIKAPTTSSNALLSSSETINSMIKNNNISMPICKEIYKILYHDKDPKQSLHNLMNRKLISEN